MFWVDGKTLAAFEQSITEIALLLGLEEELKAVLTWLGDQDSWLLVIDNAEIPPSQLLSGRLPPGRAGCVLITTRNPEYEIIAQPSTDGFYQLEGLDPEESITLLLRKAQRNHVDPKLRRLAEPIARDLMYSPMAIVTTGAELRNFRGTLQHFISSESVANTAKPSLDNIQATAENSNPARELGINSPWEKQNVLTFGELFATETQFPLTDKF